MSNKWNKKNKKKIPKGFDIIEPILDTLENELRDKVKESNVGKRKTESLWPIHQINYQKTRYVYEMYYVYKRISQDVYNYCIKNKLVDAPLIAKWKKPGYEKLCSTYVINPSNYKFGTTSICRVPIKDRSPEAKTAKDPTTGCLGCASGNKNSEQPRNIFGNKYGQSLAAVQVARENRMKAIAEKEEAKRKKKEEEEQERKRRIEEELNNDADGDAETDDDDDDETDDDDDYGPTPSAGIWAGSQKLQEESEKIAAGGDDDDDTDDEGPQLPPPSKKIRTDE